MNKSDLQSICILFLNACNVAIQIQVEFVHVVIVCFVGGVFVV